ncbi:uncharacterized protein J7T54_006153 [Emericellopsis cladophorae]|uniref:SAM-dependent MTase RsmB/NOP-type domain-containing protein n=1 Tax=Emericellopsis cladophorae TaxID=2686198 RepID=A0A9P9Y921_9HYPO|nr:uncharacterized protein J7T54_006153 [Emericellopsis cladophorae]KAI6785814.1 hypothetical protein J7T54_006153 [Emericellopsis cladophorae]
MSLYHEAAELLLTSPNEGRSLKARVFRRKDLKSPPAQLYALVLETCKWSAVLKDIVEKSELLRLERKLTPALALLLVHDLLLSKKGLALPQSHGLSQSVAKHKGRLSSEFTRARLRRKAPTVDALREQVEAEAAGDAEGYPRWVRVNALKTTVEEQLETTFMNYERASALKEVITTKARQAMWIDPHVPNLLAVTQGTALFKTEAYTSGKIILQDKASCFPAYLLDPRAEDGDVIDACAAPGNKTTHLAAVLRSHRPEFDSPPQTVYAFEKDPGRAKTLEKMVTIAGSRKTTKIGPGQDFLRVNPHDQRYANVGALLLDPSCSGSGIVGRDSMPELHLPEAIGASKKKAAEPGKTLKRKHAEAAAPEENILRDDDGNETIVKSEKDLQSRLEALASFQLTLVLHALKFPRATKVTYSTCSIHAEENESVVMKALQSDVARRRGWKILKREDQVSGLRDWDVRGLSEACDGDKDIAEGCIRSYKGDGRGVMGFFVAGFVRAPGEDLLEEEGPYIRDEDGVIVRDGQGMPVLKSTGEPVTLRSRDAEEEDFVDDGDDDIESASTDSSNSGSDDDDDDDDCGEDEWAGFGD